MAWNRTQGATGADQSGTTFGTFPTGALGSPLTNPSVLLVMVGYDDSAGFPNVTSVTDTAGNSYSRVGSFDHTSHTQAVEVWKAINNHTTGSNIATAHFGTAVGFIGISIEEYTGGGLTPSADKSSGQGVTTASPGPYLSPSVTPSVDGELITGYIFADGGSVPGTWTANGSFALGINFVSNGAFATEWFGQGSAAPVQASFNGAESVNPANLVLIVTIEATPSNVDTITEGLNLQLS